MHLYRSIEYWVESAAICKEKGLLKALGLSNCSADEVRRAVLAGKKVSTSCLIFDKLWKHYIIESCILSCHSMGLMLSSIKFTIAFWITIVKH